MKPLTLTVILITYASSYGLSCISTNNGKSLEISLEKFHYDDLIDMLKNLIITDSMQYELCLVSVRIVYKKHLLTISFTKQIEYSMIDAQQIMFETYVGGSKAENIGVYHYIEYACNDIECDKRFIFENLDWIVKGNNPRLEDRLRSLITGNGIKPVGECFNYDGIPTKCDTGTCVVQQNQANDYVLLWCDYLSDLQQGKLTFHTTLDLILRNINMFYQFNCNYNLCNDKNSFDQIVNIFNEEYDLFTVFKMFGFEEEITNMSNRSSLFQQKTNPVTTSTISNLYSNTTTILTAEATSTVSNLYGNTTTKVTAGATTTKQTNQCIFKISVQLLIVLLLHLCLA